MKHGILLTGGLGTRVKPFSGYLSKHLLNVANKPVIEYPLHTLQQLGIENLTIVVGSSFSGQILDYVQDGARYNMNINYCYQPSPRGIADAINLCQRYVGDQEFITLLGDNLFEDQIDFASNYQGAQIVVKQVLDPKKFGVIFCHGLDNIEKIEEKPQVLDHDYECWAITGCYLFDQQFFDYFKEIKPSHRQEYEVVDIIKHYHKDGKLKANPYYKLWHDMGSLESIAYVNDYFHSRAKQTW